MSVSSDLSALVAPVRLLEQGLTQSNAEKAVALADAAAKAEEIRVLRATWTPPPPVPVPPLPVPDPVPVPPVVRRPKFGATIDLRNGQSQAQANAAWEGPCGRLGVRRIFTKAAPSESIIKNLFATDDAAGRDIVFSYKGDATDAVLKTIKKIPGRKVYLVKWHEPENDGGGHTPQWYVAQTDAHIAQVKLLQAGGRDDLIPAFVLMGWVDNDNDKMTSSTFWFPTNTVGVVMLLDPYDTAGTANLAIYVMNSVSLWRIRTGNPDAPWGMAEMGTVRRGAAGAKWITDALTFGELEHAVVACYFHSGVNPLAAPGGWWLDDPLMQAAWKAKAAA